MSENSYVPQQNDHYEKKSIQSDEEYVDYYRVRIIQLETHKLFEDAAKNNVEVIFRDRYGDVQSAFYLANPDGQIEGEAVFRTLLLALHHDLKISLITDHHVGQFGERYITGVIIDTKLI
ncbi:hypothetical protein Xmau_02512 [Xenorhabdus mauleonii]|uniref:Uncharacterized protein n=1 Tax=Xenorhabdus mauleonii TaxID=351675 RepID=A0A1I3RH42_9GAMM|nr:hypothetical protein [Xenorhabdus mauleonii]PHM39906.1 hypothetical protein Xmau_02512 [Xenorhabdus mauleonii]SFJ45934.1 hypothetical protein SAMN05421680_109147 [Xenorhabdus mauleonii]